MTNANKSLNVFWHHKFILDYFLQWLSFKKKTWPLTKRYCKLSHSMKFIKIHFFCSMKLIINENNTYLFFHLGNTTGAFELLSDSWMKIDRAGALAFWILTLSMYVVTFCREHIHDHWRTKTCLHTNEFHHTLLQSWNR